MSAQPSTGGNQRHESLRLQLLPARAFTLLPLPQPDTWAPPFSSMNSTPAMCGAPNEAFAE